MIENHRKQLLLLVHRVPFPPNRGDRIRSYHLLKHFAVECDVHLATLCDEPVEDGTVSALEKICRQVEIAPVRGMSRWGSAAWSVANGRTATEGLFRSASLAGTVKKWAGNTRFDAAFVFCSSMLQYLDVPELGAVRTIVDLVDVDSQKWFDYAEHSAGPRRWLFELEGRRLRELERKAVDRASAVTLVSESEAKIFRGICPNDKTIAVPNGVDLDYFHPANGKRSTWVPLTAADRTNVVFVGALDYRANVDGVVWFVTEVWPLLRQELPQVTLGLVGRNPTPAVQKLATVPGIRVIGTVPDVRPYVAGSDVAIAPLRIARGIQNKVLEAMAMGKAIVCSSAAREGLDVMPGRDLLEAGDPSDWCRTIVKLISDPVARAKIGLQARRSAEDRYSWSASLEPFTQLLKGRKYVGRSPAAPALRDRAHRQALTG